MSEHKTPQPAANKDGDFSDMDKMPGKMPPAMQLKADSANPPIQRQGEKVGPLRLTCQGEGTISNEGEGATVSKSIGGGTIGTMDEGADVHIVPDNGLGKGKHLFIYGKFNYTKGGSGMEYVWVKASSVKMNTPAKAAPKPKEKAGAVEEVAEKDTWRSLGNLRGKPPVRSKDPHNLNVLEDEAGYNELLTLARQSLKKIKAKAAGMKTDGEITDHKYWFTKVYQYVTEGELDYITSNAFYYPSYVLRSVIYFEQVYRDNVEADGTKEVEKHWKKAFEKTNEKGTDWWVDYLDAIQCLVKSMLAHIRFDLPRCEAWVFNSYYSAMPNVKIGDFKQDFMSMAGIFDTAGVKMTAEINQYASWYWGKWQMAMTPNMGEQIAMSYYFDADMGAERADAWKRAEMLVNDGKAGADPYKITGSTLTGNATKGDNESNIATLGDGMAPSMDDASDLFDDNAARSELDTASPAVIQKWSVSKRIRMVVGMCVGNTFNNDEKAILKLLKGSTDALVTIIDGANAWTILNSLDFSQYKTARKMLVGNKYYGSTGTVTCASLITKCCTGETAEWEETMIADIVAANNSTRLVSIIERAGPRTVLDNVDGVDYTSVKKKFISDYYPDMPYKSALDLIMVFLNEVETSEWEEVMIMDILENRKDAKPMIREIGRKVKGATKSPAKDLKNGLNELEWTLDGAEDTRLSVAFGSS